MVPPGRPSIDELVESVIAAGSRQPIAAMAVLIDSGAAAVSPVLRALDTIEPDDDDWSPLWLTVVLGELRDPSAVPALLELLALPDGEVLAEAAVESLAKIGEPARPELTRFALAAGSWESRHHAYTAIGLIPGEPSLRFLLDALDRDTLLWGSIATALSDLGDTRALPRLHDLLERADDRETPALREAVAILTGRSPRPPKPHARDWRTRYAGLIPGAA